jgi:glycine cleavage system aminomethyltransferase T
VADCASAPVPVAAAAAAINARRLKPVLVESVIAGLLPFGLGLLLMAQTTEMARSLQFKEMSDARSFAEAGLNWAACQAKEAESQLKDIQ